MEIKELFAQENQSKWLEQIRVSEWEAGELLAGMVQNNTFFDFAGEGAKILLLTEGEKLVSYCTFAPMDDIKQTELTPWIGFVLLTPFLLRIPNLLLTEERNRDKAEIGARKQTLKMGL